MLRGDAQTIRADGTKKCSMCGEIKPLNEFARASKERSGFMSACKGCRKSAYRKSEMERRKQRYASDPSYRASKRASVRAAFEKNGQRYVEKQRERYRQIESLRAAATERTKAWRAANPNSVKMYDARRRARDSGANGSFKADDVKRLLEQQRAKCIYCGTDISDGLHTIEHVIPLSRGGSNSIENIALACRSCNARKGQKLPSEFLNT